MAIQLKMRMIAAAAFAAACLSAPALSADTMLGTGGYNREFRSMEMMKMIDANSDHMVSSDEYTKYYGDVFNELDKNRDSTLDTKEWVGVKGDKLTLATGGYSRELRSMDMMKQMDTDKDQKVTKDEFLKFHQGVFTAMDTKGNKMLDPQQWLARQTGNR